MRNRFIIVDEEDNVATATDNLACGEPVKIQAEGETRVLAIRQDIPFGHKFALRDIEAGDDVVKYGEIIGVAAQAIAAGDHVHVHNVDGTRGRGDRHEL